MGRLLEYVWRRHLQAATRRAMLLGARGAEKGISPVMAVGFADMVGFTMLSQHLGDEELAAVVSRFEELAHDTVVALGGRVVKMIGDEAMFVVQTATSAAEIGLSLAEAYAGDELLSDVRVALAIGPVLVQDGDFYGPVVNLASRLVGVANPGHRARLRRVALGARRRGRRGVRHAGPPAAHPEGHRAGAGVEAVPCRKRARRGPATERALGASQRGPARAGRAARTGRAGGARTGCHRRRGRVRPRRPADPAEPTGSEAVQLPSSRAVAMPWARRSK